MDQPLRDLMVCFATSLFEQRPVPAGVNWVAARSAAWRHGLIPLADEFCRRTDEVPADFKSLIRMDYLSMVARSTYLGTVLQRVLLALHDAEVPVIILKGPALAESVYPNPMLRPFSDLDLLCHEDDWLTVHRILAGMGYESEPRIETPPPKAWQRKAYYHMQYFKSSKSEMVEIHFDVWQNGLRPKLGDRFWDRAASTVIASVSSRVLSVEDQFLHLCVHLHQHGYSRLIWFTDLYLLLQRFADAIDWSYVATSARAEGVELSLYYCLYYLQQLLSVDPPLDLLAALKPNPFVARLHQRLWPSDRVLQLVESERVGFEFREVPVAKEALLNLLLTGRTREKLVYLLRVLLPPDDWLAHYYNATDRATLRRRRVVHAPKTILSALGGLSRLALSSVRDTSHGPHGAIAARNN